MSSIFPYKNCTNSLLVKKYAHRYWKSQGSKTPATKKRQLKFIRKNLTHADFALLQQHAEQSNKTKLLKNQLHLQVQRLDYTKILEGDTSELEKFLKNLSLEGKKSFHKICKQASDEHNLKKALKPLLDSSISRTIADFQQD